MKMIRSFATLVLTLLALCCARAPAQVLQLVDGKLLLAQVEDANADNLHVRRLDNGGVLDLRWDQLTPECAQRVKEQFKLSTAAETQLTVSAQEVRYNKDGSPQTLIGKLIDDGSPTLTLLQKGQQIRIPRQDILLKPTVEVPVLQVYTKDEYYNMRLQELAPGDNADAHKLLAEELMKVPDYAHALDHLNKAKELNNSKEPKLIDEMLEKLKLYVANQKERDAIDQIAVARHRAQLTDLEAGKKLVDDWDKMFPQSKLKLEFQAEKDRFLKTRTATLSLLVAQKFRYAIGTVAEKKQLEKDVKIAAIRTYAEQKMTDDIVQLVASLLRLDVAEVKTLWAGRETYANCKQTDQFAYFVGSWLLGKEAVIKGTKEGKDETKEGQDAQQRYDLERIAKKLREAMDRRRAAAAQNGQAQKEETPDDWWSSATRAERVSWLRAYYAEFGGQLKITHAFVSPCQACSGLGTISQQAEGNKIEKVPCYVCHGTKWLRSFKAY
jgi:hypothetical protein